MLPYPVTEGSEIEIALLLFRNYCTPLQICLLLRSFIPHVVAHAGSASRGGCETTN